MGSHPSKGRKNPCLSRAANDIEKQAMICTVSSPQASTDAVVLSVPASPFAISTVTGSARAGPVPQLQPGFVPKQQTTHSLQPFFVNGELASRPASRKVIDERLPSPAEANHDDDSDQGEDELVDFLDEDTFDEGSELPAELSQSLNLIAGPSPQRAASPSTPASAADSHVHGSDTPDTVGSTAGAFGSQARDYLGVLSQVFAKARLTDLQQVRASRCDCVCVGPCAVLWHMLFCF